MKQKNNIICEKSHKFAIRIIKLLFEGGYIADEQYNSMKMDIDEILKILSIILITAKQNILHS